MDTPLQTTPWNSADYLKTEADRVAYLKACLDEAPDDCAFISYVKEVIARSRCAEKLRDSLA